MMHGQTQIKFSASSWFYYIEGVKYKLPVKISCSYIQWIEFVEYIFCLIAVYISSEQNRQI
jgi:hypothetical protein